MHAWAAARILLQNGRRQWRPHLQSLLSAGMLHSLRQMRCCHVTHPAWMNQLRWRLGYAAYPCLICWACACPGHAGPSPACATACPQRKVSVVHPCWDPQCMLCHCNRHCVICLSINMHAGSDSSSCSNTPHHNEDTCRLRPTLMDSFLLIPQHMQRSPEESPVEFDSALFCIDIHSDPHLGLQINTCTCKHIEGHLCRCNAPACVAPAHAWLGESRSVLPHL